MQIIDRFPHQIKHTQHQWIAMTDGTKLSASIWQPEDINQPIPAILEFIPYRKNDGTAVRDSLFHPLFAGHGYASVRVDIRGSGDSEGIIDGEYTEQELSDAIDTINWLASQNWCNGKVGMMGKSWGGFNALQVAALQPEPLKAIISVCSTDDRYADDVHYKGGCLMTTDMLGWASTMAAWNARPPAAKIAGEQWLEIWKQRAAKTPQFIESWLQHQTRDAFWQHGSICEDYSKITAATLLVGGWADPYVNAIPRMMQGLSCPKQAIIGPWAHEYPQRARPGPQIGFTQECLRWWDYWLRDDVENSITDEKRSITDVMLQPAIRSYLPISHSPEADYDHKAGRWIGLDGFSPDVSKQVNYQHYRLQPNQLLPASEASHSSEPASIEQSISTDLSVGLSGGVFFPMGSAGDYPMDQRQSDSCSLVFDAEPAKQAHAIIGNPILKVRVKASQPKALLAARLCTVDEQGRSTLLSWGLLNLCHRNSHEQPTDVIPNQWMEITLKLNACACELQTGHHWRLSLSPNYTAHAWPSPVMTTLTIDSAQTQLLLPSIDPTTLAEPTFALPESARPLAHQIERPYQRSRNLNYDSINSVWQLTDNTDSGLSWLTPLNSAAVRSGDSSQDQITVQADQPLSTTVSCYRKAETGDPENHCDTEYQATMTCDASNFNVTWQLNLWHNGEEIFRDSGKVIVPRNHL